MEAEVQGPWQTLPPEVVENIFADPSLTVKDFCNLCMTCSTFREVLQSNRLWKTKFGQEWPTLFRVLQHRARPGDTVEPCWKTWCRQRVKTRFTVNRRLQEMIRDTRKSWIKFQRAVDESNFYDFYTTVPCDMEQVVWADFAADELRHISKDGHPWYNMNIRYYADKALTCLHHSIHLPEIQRFMSIPVEKRDIEEGATLLAQWFQPDIVFFASEMKFHFDVLAQSAKEILRNINPNHPVLSEQCVVDTENLSQSLWDSQRCKEVLVAIEALVKPVFNRDFDEHSDYYRQTNSYINLVLERNQGIPITLCLVVMCMARRLGLVLEPVNFPHHFILRWTKSPSRGGMASYAFVDVYSGRYHLTFEELQEIFSNPVESLIGEEHCQACSFQEVLNRMMRNLLSLGRSDPRDTGLNLLRHTVDLATLIMPRDVELVIMKTQIALHLKVNVLGALERLGEIEKEISDHNHTAMFRDFQEQCERVLNSLEQEANEEEQEIEPKRRSAFPEVKFAVGMIMKHKKYNYQCVIRGWDNKCEASEHWIRQMGVDRCERGRFQPFYKVMVMDGSDRYAAEENLEFTKETQLITHQEVGRMFESFTGQYYIPGPRLRAQYPDDPDVTHSTISRIFLSE